MASFSIRSMSPMFAIYQKSFKIVAPKFINTIYCCSNENEDDKEKSYHEMVILKMKHLIQVKCPVFVTALFVNTSPDEPLTGIERESKKRKNYFVVAREIVMIFVYRYSYQMVSDKFVNVAYFDATDSGMFTLNEKFSTYAPTTQKIRDNLREVLPPQYFVSVESPKFINILYTVMSMGALRIKKNSYLCKRNIYLVR